MRTVKTSPLFPLMSPWRKPLTGSPQVGHSPSVRVSTLGCSGRDHYEGVYLTPSSATGMAVGSVTRADT